MTIMLCSIGPILTRLILLVELSQVLSVSLMGHKLLIEMRDEMISLMNFFFFHKKLKTIIKLILIKAK